MSHFCGRSQGKSVAGTCAASPSTVVALALVGPELAAGRCDILVAGCTRFVRSRARLPIKRQVQRRRGRFMTPALLLSFAIALSIRSTSGFVPV